MEKETKEEIVAKIEEKSAQEATQVLCAILPKTKTSVKKERRAVVDENTVRHSINFNKVADENLKRAKEILSHKFHNATDADILAYALEFFLDQVDPLRKPSAAAASSRVTKASAKREKLKSAAGGCVFKDPLTGQVCGSRYQIQFDHIIPKALGGSDKSENLRPLCRQHNLFMAEMAFGKEHMDQFRRGED